MSTTENTVTITAQCLCKAHKFTATLSKDTLPLPASCCHCNSCRHVSGALYTSCSKWPSSTEDISALKKYEFSDTTTIFSCATCSSQMFCRVTHADALYVVTGVLCNTPGLIKYMRHMFVGDTIDGGASAWLPRYQGGTPIKRWKERPEKSEELALDWPGPKPLSAAQRQAKPSPEVTPFHCHCNGVKLQLRSGSDLESAPEEDIKRWFVEPDTLKYRGSVECCDSCRTMFGSDMMAWTFAPLSHIGFAGEAASGQSEFPPTIGDLKKAVSSQQKDPRLGTLAFHNSSPEVERYSCSKCSASVFYAVHDRPDMVDVAVGLLDHPNGARAEGLLAWRHGIVGWKQDAAGGWREGLAETVTSLSQEWADLTRKDA